MMSSTYCDAPCIEQHASIKQMCFIQQKGKNAGSIRSGTDQAHDLNGFQPFTGLLEKPVFMFVNTRLTQLIDKFYRRRHINYFSIGGCDGLNIIGNVVIDCFFEMYIEEKGTTPLIE